MNKVRKDKLAELKAQAETTEAEKVLVTALEALETAEAEKGDVTAAHKAVVEAEKAVEEAEEAAV